MSTARLAMASRCALASPVICIGRDSTEGSACSSSVGAALPWASRDSQLSVLVPSLDPRVQGDFGLSLFEDGVLPAAFMVGLLVASLVFAQASHTVNGERAQSVLRRECVSLQCRCGRGVTRASSAFLTGKLPETLGFLPERRD